MGHTCGIPVAGDGEEETKDKGQFLAEVGGGQRASVVRKNPINTYIGKRQAAVAEWVASRTIFEVYTKEAG